MKNWGEEVGINVENEVGSGFHNPEVRGYCLGQGSGSVNEERQIYSRN